MAGFEQECGKLAKKLGIRWSEHVDARGIATESGAAYGLKGSATQRDNGDGRILFSTRSKQVALTAARTAIAKLPQMCLEEATDLLKESLIDEGELHDDEKVVELLQTLTNLPLTITQAAAYMNRYEASITESIRLFINTDKENMIARIGI
ncbi:hypothetical protein QSH57_004361 [Fusarium oxysporum f. sp. vasinfectum]|nr:hypothetical protein QSH57_004361 [Fusarium oxysporum f. sp. vasinfectum]